ncbi:MAG: hypothetical protein JSV56_08275 [Methanomassiliicoccales archaeon]|nr:MAG: hypothetical protein JSV56_08275 [Methanomassiliicoccales archaeon]
MGILGDAIELGKDTIKLGIRVGEKGVDATKEALRAKGCSECREYTPKDNQKGNYAIAGEPIAIADVSTRPQRAFAPRTVSETPPPTSQDDGPS